MPSPVLTHAQYIIRTPAKLNLRLKVTGRRADGYHELISVMVPIDIVDDLEFQVLEPAGIRLVSEGLEVPVDETNLVRKAAGAFIQETGVGKGVAVNLTKRIPLAAGMGGGSSDAAATLLSLNAMWGMPLSLPDLHRLAVKLGADVPFFLYRRPSLATGIGDILEPIERWPGHWYVVVKPPFRVSTASVYRNLKLQLTRGEYHCIKSMLNTDPLPISPLLENDLEKVTSVRLPVVNTIKALLMEAGAEGALMTGSGPAVFGVFLSREEASSAGDRLTSSRLGEVFVARTWEEP